MKLEELALVELEEVAAGVMEYRLDGILTLLPHWIEDSCGLGSLC